MTKPRAIAAVVRRVRRAELDEDSERRVYWRNQPAVAHVAEVEQLRRLWTSVTGDPDLPIVRVIHRRRLGDPAIKPR